MSAESRIVRDALRIGSLATLPIAGIAWAIRGANGALSALIACAIVLGNVALSAGLSVLAGKVSFQTAAMMSLPSFTFRMLLIGIAFAFLEASAFVDQAVFVTTFVAGVVAVIVLEARAMRRTPWLALTFDVKERS